MRNRGVTRLEGMVAVLVVATTGTLFLKVFYTWHQEPKTQSAQCLSNLKQLGLGILQYTQDYDEKWPLARRKELNGNQLGWAAVITPYIMNKLLFQCPLEGNPQDTDPQETCFTDYWYNSNLSGGATSKIQHPKSTLLMGDGDGISSDSNGSYALSKLLTTWSGENPAQRHHSDSLFFKSGGANYSFADGHARWLKPEEITAPPTQGTATFAVR